MSIKYLNPKSYGQVYQKLVNGYRKVKGKDPSGLDLIKIKLEAAEQIKNSEKIIKFPEEKITPFYEERPSKGPQADVKKFPTKNKPAAQTYSSDFLDLLEEFNKISKNQPSLAEITGVSNKYPEKTGIVKSTIELLESKDPKSLSRELQRIMKREGTYVDYSDEEVAQILNGFESRTKNKIKPAEEIINEGDFDPSGFAGGGLAYMLGEPVRMFKGGRIGYSVGAGKKGVQGLLDLVKNKFGKKSITTADKIARPESAITRDLFKRMSKKLKNKLPKKGEFIEDGETPDYEYYAELLNDAEDSRGFNVQGDETIEVLEDRLKQLKDEEAYYYGQYKAGKLDPEPGEINRSRLTFLKNKSEEAEMSRDKRLITQDELEELDSLEKRFEYLDLEEKAQDVNRKLTNSEIERLKEINDSGYVDFQKEIDKINRNKKAYGGRIGFSAGGIDKARRAFLKILGGGAATGVAVKTGLGGLLKSGEKAKDVAKVVKAAETVKNAPPSYVFDLANIIRAKGKDITKQAGTIERETVKTYKGVELYETPDAFRIKTDTLGPYENSKEVELVVTKKTDVVDEGTKSQKKVESIDYEEATVTPDQEGKMKDLNFYVDDKDHAELKKLVDEEEGFKSGGLAYLLGE
jgi:hypothetical protein